MCPCWTCISKVCLGFSSECSCSWTQEPATEELRCTICGAKARTPEKLAAHFRCHFGHFAPLIFLWLCSCYLTACWSWTKRRNLVGLRGQAYHLQMRMCKRPSEIDRMLHEREMMKRKTHSRSFQRWKRAHPERLDRYRELQDVLSPPQKGYGLRRALLRSSILVIATYVACSVYTCQVWGCTPTNGTFLQYRAHHHP